MKTSLFKKAWNIIASKSVGDDLNIDLHLIKLETEKIAALEKDDWEKVATITQEIKYWESKRNIKKDRKHDILETFEDVYNQFGEDPALLREVAIEEGCTPAEAQQLVSEFLKAKGKYDKDVNVGFAGPEPKSGLARQDLVGGESSTTTKSRTQKSTDNRMGEVGYSGKKDPNQMTVEEIKQELKWISVGGARYNRLIRALREKESNTKKDRARDEDVHQGPMGWYYDCHECSDTVSGFKSKEEAKQAQQRHWSSGHKVDKSRTEKIIRHEGDKWILYSHKGKVLGRHPTKESAERQEEAVEANKMIKAFLKGPLDDMNGDGKRDIESLPANEYDVATDTSWINEDGKKKSALYGVNEEDYGNPDRPEPPDNDDDDSDEKKAIKSRIDKFLKTCIAPELPGLLMAERGDAEKYHTLADKTSDSEIAEVLDSIGDEEEHHLAELQNIQNKFDSKEKSIRKGQLADELAQAEKELQRLSSSWNGEDSVGNFEGSKVHWEDAIGELEDKIARLKRLQQLNHQKSIVAKAINKWLEGGPDSSTYGSTTGDGSMGHGDILTSDEYSGDTTKEGIGGDSAVGRVAFSRDKKLTNKNMKKGTVGEDKRLWEEIERRLRNEEKMGARLESVVSDVSKIYTVSPQEVKELIGQMGLYFQKEILPVDRPKQPLYNVRDKDVLTWAKDCMEQNNSEEIARRLISEEFGFSNSEVSEVLSMIAPALDTDQNDGRKLDPHSVEGHETSVGSESSIKSIYPFKDVLNNRISITKSKNQFRKEYDKVMRRP